MKLAYSAVLMMSLICLAADPPSSAPPRIEAVRTEHKEWSADDDGKMHYRDTVLRSNERIMETLKFKRKGAKQWGMWQTLYVNDKPVMREVDWGDGNPRTVLLIKDDQVYDAFQRQKDGSLAPVSPDELAKLREE